jgi:hypothetical protein
MLMFSLALVVVEVFFSNFEIFHYIKVGSHAATWWQKLTADFPSLDNRPWTRERQCINLYSITFPVKTVKFLINLMCRSYRSRCYKTFYRNYYHREVISGLLSDLLFINFYTNSILSCNHLSSCHAAISTALVISSTRKLSYLQS